MRLSFFLSLFLLVAAGPPAFAEEEKKVEDTPVTEWLAAESEVIEGLEDRAAKETYFVLRNKYGIIRAVRVVKRDIGNAVQACGQRNPDIQNQMNTRFKEWRHAVDPILKTADTYLNQEIREQTVVKASVLRDMLDLNDDAFDYQEGQIEKRPVTEKEACLRLLESMDRTEDDMLKLLQDILLPETVIRERAADQKTQN